MLNRIRIVLVNPSHPGNIGAVARAMKNMGLSQLVLVEPKQFPHHKATERASSAADILANAEVVGDAKTAVKNCQWVYATSSRERSLKWPMIDPKGMTSEIHTNLSNNIKAQIAIIFGAERTGLLNEELQLADKHVIIPANPEYSSLNLSQAVQIITYELFQSLNSATFMPKNEMIPASKVEFEGMMQHFEALLTSLRIWDPEHPKKLMPKIRRLFTKAQCESEEINILRGLLKVFYSLTLSQADEKESNN